MAKADKFGGGLGKKPTRRINDTKPAIVASEGMRDTAISSRLHAFNASVNVMRPLTKSERTQVVAALAEFFQLSLTVENHL